MEKCKWPVECNRKVEKNGYCFLHAVNFSWVELTPKKKSIQKFSKKRKVENRVYKKMVDKKISLDPRCKINSPVCTGLAQGADHLQKRSPKNISKESNLVMACNACNEYKESNPVWARNNGFLISRFKK